MLCVTVRCVSGLNGSIARSKSGRTARPAQASVTPLPARAYQGADAAADLHVRSPGTRSAAHAAAIPASAWPIGLGMRAAMMADSATFGRTGESHQSL